MSAYLGDKEIMLGVVISPTREVTEHIKNTDIHVTAEEKEKWNNVDFSAMEEQIASKAPMYTYGTEDLEAGVTPLETGKLHFVYE